MHNDEMRELETANVGGTATKQAGDTPTNFAGDLGTVQVQQRPVVTVEMVVPSKSIPLPGAAVIRLLEAAKAHRQRSSVPELSDKSPGIVLGRARKNAEAFRELRLRGR
jgi:hypothetical protein